MLVVFLYFRKRTPGEAKELLATKCKNNDDWDIPGPTPTPPTTPKKRVMIELNEETMREAKRSLQESGTKSDDVKYLPPIEDYVSLFLLQPLLRYTLSKSLMIEIFLTTILLLIALMNLMILLLSKAILMREQRIT